MTPKQKVLITDADGFLGKYLLKEFPSQEVSTCGASPECDIVWGLEPGEIPPLGAYDIVVHLDTEGQDESRTRSLINALDNCPPSALVFLSSTEVYGIDSGSELTEEMLTDPLTPLGKHKLESERLLASWAQEKGVNLTILRVPDVVGTGMVGLPRKILNEIYRGVYHHIADETACISVVHASDLALAVRLTAGQPGIFNITDGVNPSMHDLAEALAHRLDDKRIFTLSPRRAKWMARICDWIPVIPFGTDALAARYRTLTFSNEKLCNATGMKPVSVTDYLRNHVYDENSL